MAFNLQDFAEQLQASRKVEHTVEGITFLLTVPNDYAIRCAVAERETNVRALRFILDSAIYGWRGCRTRALWQDAPEDAEVPFSPEAFSLLLDHRSDIADELTFFISKWRNEQEKRREEARKNLLPASSGT
jgi:hypothetical protein